MPKWLKGSLLALIALTFFRSVAILAASESSKTSARWFLLVPPFVLGNPPGPLQLKAPLGQWTELDSTETAADCDEQRDNMTRMYQSADTTSTTIQFGLLLYHYALCVPSADPRLRLGHRNHRLARSFTGLTGGNRGTIAYAGPPVQPSSDVSNELPIPDAGEAKRSSDQGPILLMLLGVVAMAAAAPLGGWLREKTGWTLLKQPRGYRRC
jgi:hypothetical protein